MRVNRRHIIYVQGYDPRGLAQYYRMFRSELRKFAALYGFNCKVGRPASTDARAASWTIDTQGPDWQTQTRYDFLRWEDLIKADLEWPIWRTVTQALAIYIRLIFNGVLTRFRKAIAGDYMSAAGSCWSSRRWLQASSRRCSRPGSIVSAYQW